MTKSDSSKQKVLVVYGGPSTEHEVSCRSAEYIIKNLNKDKYEVSVMAVGKNNRWKFLAPSHWQGKLDLAQALQIETSRLTKKFSPDDLKHNLTLFANETSAKMDVHPRRRHGPTWVIFPIIHGYLGEDGLFQGFLETLGLPYVGADLMASSICMDKVVAKNLVAAAGIKIVPFVSFRRFDWQKSPNHMVNQIIAELDLPVFVKPARGGSSVGIKRVKTVLELTDAINFAFKFDDKILIEKALSVREIEYGALGGYDADISDPGEVIIHSEFYDYEAKYLNTNASEVKIPAKLKDDLKRAGKDLAKKIFKALDLYGMARIDLFLEKQTNTFYFNEANTIPGFTSISQYPKLWEHAGFTAASLLDRLIELALLRHKEKITLQRFLS